METSARRPKRAKRDPLSERLKARVPQWYRPGLQWMGTMLVFGAFAAVIAWLRPEGRPGPWAFAAIPMGLLLASGVEYATHRFPMHHRYARRRRSGLNLDRFFRRHTLLHHRYFDHTHLEMSSRRDGFFVLANLHTTTSTVLLLAVTFLLMRGLIGPHVANLATITMVVYAMAAETLHVAYHFPESRQATWPLRTRAFQHLRELHRDHHNPRVMTSYNFAIGLPIWDLICGTYRAPPSPIPTPPQAEPLVAAAASHTQLGG